MGGAREATKTALAVGVGVCLQMAACGDLDGDELVVSVGSAPRSTTHITVPATQPGAYAEPDAWPRACDLLTEADVRAVLPDITRLSQESAGMSFTPGFNPEVDVRDAHCNYFFHMAGAEDGADPIEENQLQILLTVELAGSPEWVGDNFEIMNNAMTPEDSLGSMACYGNPREYLCRTQDVAFTILTTSIPGIYRFEDQDDEDLDPYFHDHVMPELVKAITSKLAPS